MYNIRNIYDSCVYYIYNVYVTYLLCLYPCYLSPVMCLSPGMSVTPVKSIFVPILYYYCYLLLKEVGSARLRESDLHPISPNTPALQYQPYIYRKERKGKIVKDKNG